MARLHDRLLQIERSRFVGREEEQARFQAAITAETLPFLVLYLHGPGGVGKTMLLKMFLASCEREGIRASYLDARNIEVSAAGFTAAWEEGIRKEPNASNLIPNTQHLTPNTSRKVVFIDTYENLAPLDDWIRDIFLPEIADDTLVVLAGRIPPTMGWRAQTGWQELCEILPIRNLNAQESRLYLANRSVPTLQRQSVLDFTHGHPLALALVADLFAQRPEMEFTDTPPLDVVQLLVQRFVEKVPGPTHRDALEIAALVRVVTEDLLTHILDAPDAYELFQWLRGLSFMERSDAGLFVHDSAREALMAELRWRNPERFAQLLYRARTYYDRRFLRIVGRQTVDALSDYAYLHRHNPIIRLLFDGKDESGLFTDTLRPGDLAEILAMTERHEGAESAQIAVRWLSRFPHKALVFRKSAPRLPTQEGGAEEGLVIGWMLSLPIENATQDDFALDPAVRAACAYLQTRAPLLPGEKATLFRFWMDGENYQAVSPVQNLVFIHAVRHYLTTENLAFTFFPCANPNFWSLVLQYADIWRLPEADFAVGGRACGMYGHDWRTDSQAVWLNRMNEREMTLLANAEEERKAEDAEAPTETARERRREEFDTALRNALRDFTQPDKLRANPLLNSSLVNNCVRAEAQTAQRIQALRELILTTARPLLNAPRDAKLYHALELAYFTPASSQEKAAESLDISYASFRRHLAAGVERLSEALWPEERRE